MFYRGKTMSWGLISFQFFIAVIAMLIMVFAPSRYGPILIVSLRQEDAGRIARWAIEHEARLLGVGPIPNSLVVVGSRSSLSGAAWRHGGLLLTGAFTGCGRSFRYAAD